MMGLYGVWNYMRSPPTYTMMECKCCVPSVPRQCCFEARWVVLPLLSSVESALSCPWSPLQQTAAEPQADAGGSSWKPNKRQLLSTSTVYYTVCVYIPHGLYFLFPFSQLPLHLLFELAQLQLVLQHLQKDGYIHRWVEGRSGVKAKGSTLASSPSSCASASSKLSVNSSFSCSSLFFIFSSSWTDTPPSDSWFSKSFTSSAERGERLSLWIPRWYYVSVIWSYGQDDGSPSWKLQTAPSVHPTHPWA